MTPSQPKSGEMSDSKGDSKAFLSVGRSSREDLPPARSEQPLSGCACRWDGDKYVERCELHDAWKTALHEWADRAKAAEQKLAALVASHKRLQEALQAFMSLDKSFTTTCDEHLDGIAKTNPMGAAVKLARAAIALATKDQS